MKCLTNYDNCFLYVHNMYIFMYKFYHSIIKLTSRTRQLFNAEPLPFNGFSCNSAHVIIGVAQQNILGFDVSVNDLAFRMQIIQTL